VRADDPRLEKAHQEMTERIKKYDERMLTVIKNHLGFEESLNDLLSAGSRRWKGRPCAGKIEVGKEINPPEIEKPVWDVMEAGNKLRNAVAHGHKESIIAARMSDFRKAHLATLTPQQAKGIEDLDDIRAVVLAYTFCGAFVVVAAERLRERKKSAGEKRQVAASAS
jgi:hypothetical protein